MNLRDYIQIELRQHFKEYPPTFIPLSFADRYPRWRNDIEEDEWTTEMNNAFVDDLIAAMRDEG